MVCKYMTNEILETFQQGLMTIHQFSLAKMSDNTEGDSLAWNEEHNQVRLNYCIFHHIQE